MSTWNFEFNGGRPLLFQTYGSGSFSYNGNPENVGLKDLTNFQLAYSYDTYDFNSEGNHQLFSHDNFQVSQNNLTDFALAVDTQNQTALSLEVRDSSNLGNISDPSQFDIFTAQNNIYFYTSAFTVADITISDPPSAVPEPGMFLPILFIFIMLLGFAFYRIVKK